MEVHILECWNCGQTIKVTVAKLATARCENCQQNIVMEEDSSNREEHDVSPPQYQPIVKQKSGIVSWVGSFLFNLTIALLVLAVLLYLLVSVVKKYDLVTLAVFSMIGIPFIKILFKVFQVVIKDTNAERE